MAAVYPGRLHTPFPSRIRLLHVYIGFLRDFLFRGEEWQRGACTITFALKLLLLSSFSTGRIGRNANIAGHGRRARQDI